MYKDNHENSWSAAKLLEQIPVERRQHVLEEIAARKLLYRVFNRRYNVQLCSYVERRLTC